MTPSEELVFNLCRRSFLSLWSYANPLKGPGGKELCDALVVCDPDVIIFSVKEVRPKPSGDVETDWARWTRRAIEESVAQIHGAERWLQTAPRVIAKDGREGLSLPDIAVRRVHRVAVALGSGGQIPIASGDLGRGYVHILEEGALDVVMRELDTITDFTEYLRAKEALPFVMVPGEENLLAAYLRNGRTFPAVDVLHIEGDLWERLIAEEAYKARRRADAHSLAFDDIIERFCRDALAGELEPGSTFSEAEQVVRVMARENRFSRRILGKGFTDFYERAARKEIEARMTRSPSGVVYVFLALGREVPREARKEELALRCFVARGLHRDAATTVVGLATERYEGKPGVSFDGCYLHLPAWTDAHQQRLAGIQRDLGYFAKALQRHTREDEYPGTTAGS